MFGRIDNDTAVVAALTASDFFRDVDGFEHGLDTEVMHEPNTGPVAHCIPFGNCRRTLSTFGNFTTTLILPVL